MNTLKTSWQDMLIAIGSWILALSLIPSIIELKTPDWKTCLITAPILTSFVISFYTLNLKNSAMATFAAAFCWWILLYQSLA